MANSDFVRGVREASADGIGMGDDELREHYAKTSFARIGVKFEAAIVSPSLRRALEGAAARRKEARAVVESR